MRLARLKLRAVSFGYQGEPLLLRELSLELARGEVLILWGRSGSGKSTLLKLLLGHLRPLEGQISWLTEEGKALKPAHPDVMRALGYQPQELLMPSYMTVSEAITQLFRLLRLQLDRDRLSRLAERLRVPTDRPVSELSLGEVSRGALLRAIAGPPDFALLDEPTAHLDADSTSRVLEVLNQVLETTGLIIATHDLRVRRWAEARGSELIELEL